ncbi:MAG TPA: hypothetical protein VLS85_07285 [Hanamia sp.]|nr:hypothetical protein [Hanamia sp.]
MNNTKQFSVFTVAILLAAHSFAQNNDMPDSRRKTESFERYHTMDVRAELATFTLAGIGEGAPTTPLEKVPYTSLGKDSIVFEGNGIKAEVKTAPFDPAKHKLNYDDKYLVRIDRRPYYGNYGKVPKTEISNVMLIIRGDTINIPSTAYNDLFNLNFTYLDKGLERTTDAVYISKVGQRVYLYLFSKDNTGSYEVTWIIQDRRYLRRILDYGFM